MRGIIANNWRPFAMHACFILYRLDADNFAFAGLKDASNSIFRRNTEKVDEPLFSHVSPMTFSQHVSGEIG